MIACPTQLKRLDKVQRWFLHELGISDTEAFVNFNFAPPSIRRAIGLLGFLHKRTLGTCHPLVTATLPVANAEMVGDFHTKALDPCTRGVNYQQRLHSRSLYSYIYTYSRLPQAFVDIPSVSAFQSRLTHLAKHRATNDQTNWRGSWQTVDDAVHMLYGS